MINNKISGMRGVACVDERPLGFGGFRVGRAIALLLWMAWWPTCWSDDALSRWRDDAIEVRRLADNHAPAALVQALSLHERLPAAAPAEDRIRSWNLLARIEAYLGQADASTNHAALAQDLARTQGLMEGAAEARLADILNQLHSGDIRGATSATEEALVLLQGSKNDILLSEAMLRAASVYLLNGQVDDAITVSLQLLEVAQHSRSPLALAYAYQALGMVYTQSNRSAEAADHYARMHELARLTRSDLLDAHSQSGQAALLLADGDIAGAERMARAAIQQFRAVGTPLEVADSLSVLASILRAKKDHAGSLQTLQDVAAIYERHPNKLGQWWLCLARSDDHRALGQMALALKDIQRCTAIAGEIGLAFYFTESTRRQAQIEAALGHHQAAYEWNVRADAYAKQVEKDRIGTRLNDLSQRFQSESRQREISRLQLETEAQSQLQRWLFTWLGAAALLLALCVYHLWRMRNIQRRTAELNSELRQSRNRLQGMLNALPDLVFETDAEGRYLSCHTREHALLVSPVADLIGRTIYEVLPPHVAEVAGKALREAQLGGVSAGAQYSLQLPQGLCWFDLSIAKMEPGQSGKDERFIILVRDVTARRQAEAALQESEHRYRQIFESVSDALYMMELTPEGRLRNLAFNPAFEISSGLSRHDLVGRYMDETFPPEAARITQAKIDRCLATGQRHDETITLELAEGIRHLHATVIPVRDESGRIHRVVGIGRDITDQERAKQLMLTQIELDRRLAHFADLAPGFMFTYQQSQVGKRGIFLYASPGIEDVCGVTADQLLADPATFLLNVQSEQIPAMRQAMNEAARARDTCQIEYQIQHPTKGTRWLEIRATPEAGDSGPVLWHGHVMDISNHKAAEDRLQASERAFRTLAENFPDPIARFDLQGGLAYINAKVARLMARPPTADLTRRPTELDLQCDPAPAASVEMNVARVIATGEPCEQLEHWSTRLGERIFEIRHIPEKDDAGRLVSVMSVGRNVTRQKRAEQELKQSRDELRRLSAHLNDVREQERKRIAREIHDELGQMLTALKLDLGTLRLQFGAVHPVLEQRSQRLIGVVEDTIGVVRSLATALRPSSLDMGLVPAAEWLVAEFRKRSDVECVLHTQTQGGQISDEQSTALFRMLQEALTNVTRHARARRVDIVLGGDDQHLTLRVSDDGVGFEADARKPRSFGLVGIHERALILGGFARIHSAPGEGTTVEVSIPRTLNERQLS